MTDYIGPFGPASVEAALRRFEESAPAPYMARIRDFTEAEVAAGALAEADEQAALSNRALFAAVLSAAVSAIDRDALVALVRGVHWEVPYAAPRRWDNPLAKPEHARAVIEALFPTEGEAEDG